MNTRLKRKLTPYVAHLNATKAEKTVSGNGKIKEVLSHHLTIEEKELLEELANAWKAYLKTEEGMALVQDIEDYIESDIRAAIDAFKNSDQYKAAQDKIQALRSEAKSLSIGLNVQFEAGLGVTCTFGESIGIGDYEGLASANFIRIGITEDLGAGVLIGAEFGLWNIAPGDMEGYSNFTGEELMMGPVTIATSEFYDSGYLGTTSMVALGVAVALSQGQCYTFLSDTEQDLRNFVNESYQERRGKPNLLRIETITCVNQRRSGNDEVYFTFKADDKGINHFFPTYDYYSMDNDPDHGWNKWNCNRTVWFDQSVKINLYDDGSGNLHQNATSMGSQVINLGDLTTASGKQKEYTIDYDPGKHSIYKVKVKLLFQGMTRQDQAS